MHTIKLFFRLFGKTVPTLLLAKDQDPEENILHLIALVVFLIGVIGALYLGYSMGDMTIFGLALLVLAALDMVSYFILKWDSEKKREF